jgi:hypothetical protein
MGFAAELAGVLLPYIEEQRRESEALSASKDRDARVRYRDAPQVIVPNRGGVDVVRLLGRLTRFRRADGPYPVAPDVPVLGRWLTFLADRAEFPGSALLLPLTGLLAEQWATGQSPAEDANLATLLAWIDPPRGMSGLEAAADAEDSRRFPPAGPSTDAAFDNDVLADVLAAHEDACRHGDEGDHLRTLTELTSALEARLTPVWEMVWRGIALLRAVPEAAGCEARWADDRDRFTELDGHIAAGGPPQPRRDHAVTAARRLADMERALAAYQAQQAIDDPYVLAERRTTGEAFGGTVEAAEPDRIEVSDRGRELLRPRFTVRTDDPLRIPYKTKLVDPARPKQRVEIVSIVRDGAGSLVELEVVEGMGTVRKPVGGSVPEVGETVRYTPPYAYRGTPEFPTPETTPWTHGRPPHTAPPDEASAHEEWGT